MEQRGVAGRPVGAVGLGCMGMSWSYGLAEQDDARSIAVIHEALDLGVDHLDTADMYGMGRNEELVGRALAGTDRDRAFLATKVGLVVDDPATYTVHRDGSPEHVRTGIDASLRRLGVDHVDLWYLHRVDEHVPLAETWGAMAEAVAAGKARAIGLSEVTLEQLAVAQAIHPVAAVQSELSLWSRDALGVALETEEIDAATPTYGGGGAAAQDVVGWCRDHGAAFVAFSPLGRGYLTGTVSEVADDDFRARNPRFQRAALERNRRIVDAVAAVAARHDALPGQVALAWVLAQGPHVVAIPGTKRPEYLRQNAAAADLVLTEQDLDELSRIPAVAGTRY